MIKPVVIIAGLIIIAMIIALPGCEKERIVESTEYVHDIEYVQLPADTVYQVDTVSTVDPVELQNPDTVVVTDTLLVGADTVVVADTVIVADTVVQTDYIYDTTMVHDTTLVFDTVEIVTDYYDTVVVTDTVQTQQCNPNEYFAVTAMQFYCNQTVIEAIYNEFGYDDGWVFYLNTFQLDLTSQSDDVYDIYGYIDYWTPDWSGFYAFEFYWRMVYHGGDPADVANWEMTMPPSLATAPAPGVRRTPDNAPAQRSLR